MDHPVTPRDEEPQVLREARHVLEMSAVMTRPNEALRRLAQAVVDLSARRIEDYRSGYSAGWSHGKNVEPMSDLVSAHRFFRTSDVSYSVPPAAVEPRAAPPVGADHHAQLLTWAAELVRAVCGAELARDIDRDVAEPVRRIALQMRDYCYERAAGPSAASREWRPIETAPKDGAFLVYHGGAAGPRIMVSDGRMLALSRLRDTPGHLSGQHWTHWMPLPDPPGATR
jgi:hypothetical protein